MDPKKPADSNPLDAGYIRRRGVGPTGRNILGSDHWTPERLELFAKLRKLAKEDLDACRRLFAEATWDLFKKAFMQRHQVKEAGGRWCVIRVLGKSCRHYPRQHECRPPGSDHDVLFQREGKPVVYVTQPYHIDTDTARDMVAFAERHGLEFDVQCLWWPSFHFPTGTNIVVWTRRGYWQERGTKKELPNGVG